MRPNIIVICIDTLRWDYLGCYGANDWIRTPLIDAYAASATRFDGAYCGSFPTVPIRVDCYTGDVNWPRYGWKGLDADQPALPALLRDQGYYAGLVLDTRNNIGAGLHEYYDEHHLIEAPASNTVHPEDIEFDFPRERVRQNGRGYASDKARTAHYERESDWFVARTMQRACDWLEDNLRRAPLFLWVDTFEPHELWEAPDHYTRLYSQGFEGNDYAYPNYGHTEQYAPGEMERLIARYAAEVTLTDRWVGHLLRHIDYLGLFENSLVVLMGDHGMYLGEHQRMGKHTVNADEVWPLHDEVARVPFLVWSPWPGAPTSTNALVQFADLMPTALEAAGVEVSAPYGRSWLPVARGEREDHWDHIFTSCHSWQGRGGIDYLRSLIAVTTPEWSLHLGPPPHEPELYDRCADPGHTRNLAGEHPDTVAALRQALADFMVDRGGSPEYARQFALGEG